MIATLGAFRDSAVNIAARVEGIAPGNEIYFTEAGYLSMSKAEVPCEKVGTHDFKGVPDPVTVYRVIRKKPGKTSKTGELVYPYGGTHQSVKTGWSANNLLRYKIPAIAVSAVQLLIILASLLIDTEPDLIVQAQSHLAEKQYNQLKLLVDKRLLEEPKDPQALLLRGHILYASKQGKEAINNYALALEVDDQIRNNQIMADNLVNSLGRFSDATQTESHLVDRVKCLCLWGEAKATVAELEGEPTRQISTTVKKDNDQAPESVESN